MNKVMPSFFNHNCGMVIKNVIVWIGRCRKPLHIASEKCETIVVYFACNCATGATSFIV